MARLIPLSILLLAAVAGAQDEQNPFGLGRPQDISARPMGLGGSYTAVAADGSALYYNPAGLAAVKKHELSLSLERTVLSGIGRSGEFPSARMRQEEMRIQSLSWLLPVPTVRGGLTFAFGYYRPRTFSDVIGFEDAYSATRGPYRYRADGALQAWRAGFGVDLAPDVTFGLAAGYVSGSEEIVRTDSLTDGYLRNYDGFDVEPSLMFKLSPRLKLGVSMVVWEPIFNLEEVYEVKDEGNDEKNFRARFPFQAKSGAAYQGDSWLVAADARLNAWSQFQYGPRSASTLQKAGYRDELILSAGGEKFIRPANMVLRAGYAYTTLPERSFDPTYDLHRLSAGASFLFGGALSLDFAYSYSFWGWGDPTLSLDNREHRALATFSYRY
jgi:hypothetical protein